MAAILGLSMASLPASAQSIWTNALSFDGTNDYVVISRPVSNDFTIECWFRSTQIAGEDWQWYFGMGLVDGEVAHTTNDFGLALGAGKVLFGTGGTNDVTIRSAVVADGNWHHVAATRRQSNGAMQLYVDGQLVVSGTNGTSTLSAPPQMRLGSLATGLNFFQGELDEVRIWNVVRTAEQIRQHLGHPLSGTESNLAAYFRLDEGAGGTAFDSTTNDCDGTINGAQWVASTIPRWGDALSFDGTTSDYVKAANFAGFPSNAITVEFWMQSSDTTKNGTPFSYATTADGDNTFLIYNYRNFQIYVRGVATTPTGVSANDGQWHHIATTWSSGTGECLLYRDGLLVCRTNLVGGTALPSGGTLVLGQDQDSVGGGFDATQAFLGRLDEVRIWNRVRSQAEIQDDSCHPLTGTESNLVAYYRFDERSGTAAYDSTAYGHNATVTSGTVWTSSTIPLFININAGLPEVDSGSVAWGDYDNDGRLDILLTGYTDSGYIAQVWRNTGNGFTNINAGLPGVYFSSVAWGDYDNDGLLDILLTGFSNSGWIAQVWRNTGSGFTNINAGLPGVEVSSIAWGDYDNDGLLDILLTGLAHAGPDSNAPIAQVWRNTGSGFTNINAGLPGVQWSSVAWGDYDNDGWLDILLTGSGIAQVWRNTGSGFTNINAGLTGVGIGSVAWGDYDNDGRLDILLTGHTGSDYIAQVWRNTVGGFTNINVGLPGVSYSSVAWSDFDNDGRLDILLTGYTGSNGIAQAWRNIAPQANTLPSAPDGLTSDAVRRVSLSWSAAADAQTATNGLTYNLRVDRTPGGCDAVAPHADPTNGFRRVSALGNVQHGLTAMLTNLNAGTYYWSVQAVDTAFAGSAFAPEQSFHLLCAPRVTTLTPTNPVVGSNDCVLLRGAVNPGDLATTAWFEWGTSTNYGTSTPAVSLDATNVAVSVTNFFCGLVPGAFYHVRVVASNSLGVVAGPDVEFDMPGFVHINAGLPGASDGSVAWGDFDNDGDLDILLTGWTGSNRIAQVWRNTATGFTNTGFGLTETPGSGAWGDYDNDGFLDLLIVSASMGSEVYSDVWRNTGAGFTNINAMLSGMLVGKGAWGDYDSDGRLDILLSGLGSDTWPVSELWRNTGSGFTKINAGLPGVQFSSAAWGDYDNDGRLDILLSGHTGETNIADVWRNTGSGFTKINAGLPQVAGGSVAWGDYDNDGWLDILMTGSTESGSRVAQVWRNTGTGFTNINAGLTGVASGSAAWGDYDNDGRLDILLTGSTASGSRVAQVWRNTDTGFRRINAGLTGVSSSSVVAWGDYDNDGRLDVLLAGDMGSGLIAQVWRNIGPVTNTAPAAPTGLVATMNGPAVTFNWNAADDAQTPANGLTYNLRVGTTPGGSDVVSPHASPTNGLRRVPAMGNAQLGLSAVFPSLPPRKYYWSVQAVDTAFAGSPFAPEQSFDLAWAPQVTTLEPTDVAAIGSNAWVMLHGAVNPGGLVTTAWFEWGTTTNYGNTTLPIEFGVTGATIPVSHWLSGLARDTNYHVRLVGSNALGVVAGEDLLFSTYSTLTNLAGPNSGFESWETDPWFGFGWSMIAISPNPNHTGTASLHSLNRSNSWCGPARSLIGTLQDGCSYRISIWVRMASGGDQPVALTIKKVDSTVTNYYDIDIGTADGTNWTQLSGSYTFTTTGGLTELVLYVQGPPPFTEFYIDDLVIELESSVAAIDAAVKRQTIEGFGGSIVFYNNWLTAHPYKQEIYTNIFAGLNLGMLRIGNWYRYQTNSNFDPEIREVVSNANQILGRSVAIEMSSWSPPAFLKSNGKTTDGGTLIWTNGGFAYTNFANYWYDSLLRYKTNGVVPTYISIQNEPDFETWWDTCKFLPNEGWENGTNYASYALALAAAYQRLTNLPSPPKLLGPEVAGIGVGNTSVSNYATAMYSNHIYGVAHHLYNGGDWSKPGSFIPNMQWLTNVFPGKPKFQTEYGTGNMLQTAMLLHHSLTVEEVSSYLFWSLVWPKLPPDVLGSALVQQEFPWNQDYWTNAPPGSVTQPRGYWLTPQYYAMKHFSYFVEPGYRRVQVSAGSPYVAISAYVAPDTNRLVVVIVCTNSSAQVVDLNPTGFTVLASAVYQTIGTNAETSRFAALGAAPPDLQLIVPGYSITTVVLYAQYQNPGPATNPHPANGAVNVTLTPTLTWSAGANATSHRVFFGYNSNAVATATTASPEYRTNSTSASFNPGTLASSGRYFWRVDEMGGTNATPGAAWTFATAVNPADAPRASVATAGSDSFVMSFASQLGPAYRVEYSDSLTPPQWLPATGVLAGTGNVIQITNAIAPAPAQRFYRVVLLSP